MERIKWISWIVYMIALRECLEQAKTTKHKIRIVVLIVSLCLYCCLLLKGANGR